MKPLLYISSALLFIGLADLPIGYYTFLRIIVTIGAISVVLGEYENKITPWVLIFGLIGILFNPIIPVYLHDKEVWGGYRFYSWDYFRY